MFRPTRIQIDAQAVHHNLNVLRECNGHEAFFCAMVKANAYGHGAVHIAHLLERLVPDLNLGVALVEEGLELREAGVRAPILCFAPFTKAAASAMLTHQLTPVVGRFEDLHALTAVMGKSGVDVHVKFNTGMNRLGFDAFEVGELKATLQRHPQIRVLGVCTHLTHGEEAHESEGFTQKQIRRFITMSEAFPGVRHVHKSSSLAVLAERGLRKDPALGARCGISLMAWPTTAPELRRRSGPCSVGRPRWRGFIRWKRAMPFLMARVGSPRTDLASEWSRWVTGTDIGGRCPIVGKCCFAGCEFLLWGLCAWITH